MADTMNLRCHCKYSVSNLSREVGTQMNIQTGESSVIRVIVDALRISYPRASIKGEAVRLSIELGKCPQSESVRRKRKC